MAQQAVDGSGGTAMPMAGVGLAAAPSPAGPVRVDVREVAR